LVIIIAKINIISLRIYKLTEGFLAFFFPQPHLKKWLSVKSHPKVKKLDIVREFNVSIGGFSSESSSCCFTKTRSESMLCLVSIQFQSTKKFETSHKIQFTCHVVGFPMKSKCYIYITYVHDMLKSIQ
jgi:hypothetical protein